MVPDWLSHRRGEWLIDVETWLEDALASSGERRLATEAVKERPWGAVLRVVTSERTLFFKAVGPGGRHELRLLADIGARAAGLAPDVLDVEHERGWLLMPDHGTAVVDVADAQGQLDAVVALLPAYAALQRATLPMADDWIAAGVPDRSPSHLPGALEDLLDGRGATGPLPIDAAEIHHHRAGLTDLERVCERLAQTPASIDHADIHGTNVLVGAGTPRLIDWGDACVTHPFSSILVPIEWVARLLPAPEQTRAVDRIGDAYAEGWGPTADRDTLGLAMWIAYIARAASNDEQCAGGSPDHVRDGQREIVSLLRAWTSKRADLDRPERLLAPVLDL